MELKEKLLLIQTELKAPKNQRNAFGNYNYRSAEDILESAKPLCLKHRALLTLTDDIVVMGEHNPIVIEEQSYSTKLKKEVTVKKVYGCQRFYTKAFAILSDLDSDVQIIVTASAREEEEKAGMDSSQITGSASSYARKYALNGMFDIDDTKDADATNTHGKDDSSDLKGTQGKTIQLVTENQLAMLKTAYVGDDLNKLLKFNKLDKLEEMTMTKASELIGKLKAKAEEKAK